MMEAGFCGVMSIFSSLRYCLGDADDYSNVWVALYFLPFGLFFDFFDGRVARWRNKSSLMGQELDSLADLVRGYLSPARAPHKRDNVQLTLQSQISFGVAPAMVAFTIGFRTALDTFFLTVFVLSGLTRLARFNVTVAMLPKDASGKSKYFEGTPIPTTLFTDGIMAWWLYNRWVHEDLPFGVWGAGSTLEFHPIVLMFVLHGCMMVSRTIQIPKP